MFILIRTLTYATLFIGFVLVYLPARVLAWAGISRPVEISWPQILGIAIGILGAALALSCVVEFARIGKGTPAPFDPTSTPRDSRALSLRAQPDVHRCIVRPGRSGTLLHVAQSPRLRVRFSARLSLLHFGLRGADSTPQLWARIHGLLSAREALVALISTVH